MNSTKLHKKKGYGPSDPCTDPETQLGIANLVGQESDRKTLRKMRPRVKRLLKEMKAVS